MGFKYKYFFFGPNYNLTYKYFHIGTTTKSLLKIVEGRNFYFNFLNKNEKNLILYNNELIKIYNSSMFKSIFAFFQKNFSFEIEYLTQEASTVNKFELNIDNYLTPKKNKRLCDYFINVNENFLINKNYFENTSHTLIIYQHYLRDKFFNFADLILPSKSFNKINSQYYINCFGILKVSRQFSLLYLILLNMIMK